MTEKPIESTSTTDSSFYHANPDQALRQRTVIIHVGSVATHIQHIPAGSAFAQKQTIYVRVGGSFILRL